MQQRNYYQDLQIDKDATQAQIAQSYRLLALQHHPKLSKEDANQAYKNFCKISEAYEVLSDRKKRDFYDIHGEIKLKEGFFLENNLKGGYSFQGNPGQIFEQFFGTDNPFAQIYDRQGKTPIGSLLGFQFGTDDFMGIELPKNLHVDVPCTLSELHNGCKKQVSYKRTILNGDGRTTREIAETKTIEIKKGYQHEYPIVYKELGNQQAGVQSSDLIFFIKQLKDKKFKRVGNDLIYTTNITLAQVLLSDSIELITLDGRQLFVPNDEIVGPKSLKVVEGEGMPIYNSEEFTVEHFNKKLDRGNLVIKFNIKFPPYVEEEKKQELQEILSECFSIKE